MLRGLGLFRTVFIPSRNMATTMRAVRVHEFGSLDVLKLEEVPVPKPSPKEILIRVHAAGVNPVETYIRSGIHARLPQLPYTPGADAAGVVEAVGPGVTKLKVGDRVFCTRKALGSYAEYCICADDSCWILPSRLTFAQGAAVGVPYFTAYRALFQRAHVKPSQSLLVHGASGAVGLATVQLAKAHGMVIYGTAGTDAGLNLVKANGAHYAFNHRKADYANELLGATGGQGFDVIAEMLSNVNLGKDFELLKQNGTILVIGSRGTVEVNPRSLMTKDATIVGMSLGNATDCEWEEMGAFIGAGLANGTLAPVVDKEYPLEKVADAHKDIIESSGAKGNLILNMGHRL